MFRSILASAFLCLLPARIATALDPHKQFTQYMHRVWTQAEGLPQDTVRAIAQSRDGYLWAGTDEGLARFDGYRFVVYRKAQGQLPANAVTALCAARDGSLWIGTTAGLASLRDGIFQTWSAIPGASITDIRESPDGSIWVAAGLHLIRVREGNVVTYAAPSGPGFEGVRTVLPERGAVWVAGYGYVGKLEGDRIVPVTRPADVNTNIAMSLGRDRAGNLLLTGTEGLFIRTPQGWSRYTSAHGLPETFARTAAEDRDGNLWVGTNGGLARRQGGRFVDVARDSPRAHDWVWCVYEDRAGNLWVGTNSGLHQYLDQQFTVFTRAEGLPSDQPVAVFEDAQQRIWVGFHDSGAGQLTTSGFRPVKGLPSEEVFTIRGTRSGELLVGTRGGLSFVRNGRIVRTFVPPDPLGRRNVFDTAEDAGGRIWAATNQGLVEVGTGRNPVKGGTLLVEAAVVLSPAHDGALWMGTYGQGLWHVSDRGLTHYTTADGLPSDQIRSLHEDADGTLWIGTFSGGLSVFRRGKFSTINTQHGLPSDNIARILSDQQGAIWLATTRGLTKVTRADLEAVLAGRAQRVNAAMYGIAEGLRSAQSAPGYPIASGGTIGSDGRLWFPTGFGVAVLDPSARPPHALRPPPARIITVLVDGVEQSAAPRLELPADTRRVEIHYAAVELTAPSALQYRVRLEGVDRDWTNAGNRRIAEYNNLRPGSHRFMVAATLDAGSGYGQPAGVELYRMPRVYETLSFRLTAAALLAFCMFGVYRWRLRQVQKGFALVLEERARLAREIHDTLAQGFVGISSQLDAVAATMPQDTRRAMSQLELARRMSQHSLTEARRSIMDLRAGALEHADLATAIAEVSRQVAARTPVAVNTRVDANGIRLPRGAEQQLLRIVQEAIANSIKHAAAARIDVELGISGDRLRLAVRDDGHGFNPEDAFLTSYGHFGLIGMRERAEGLGGELRLDSAPGSGTTIEVFVPLPST